MNDIEVILRIPGTGIERKIGWVGNYDLNRDAAEKCAGPKQDFEGTGLTLDLILRDRLTFEELVTKRVVLPMDLSAKGKRKAGAA